ncbi:MAG: hypothetical protein JWM27_3137, partial [Gemmatimonadetes bacterium]|nr:hypothetical protein [Gemmatimonadota bacterium]
RQASRTATLSAGTTGAATVIAGGARSMGGGAAGAGGIGGGTAYGQPLSGLAAAAPPMVQRQAQGAPESAGGSAGPVDAAPELPTVSAQAEAPQGPDVGAIANQVYELLVRRLVSERRQRGW